MIQESSQQDTFFAMLKFAFSVLAVFAIGGAAQAGQVGIRHEAGASHRSITGGQQWSTFNGRTETTTRTRSRSVTSHGDLGGEAWSGGAVNAPGAVSGGAQDRSRSRSREFSRTDSYENFAGGSSNNFSGGSSGTFSESSVFAR